MPKKIRILYVDDNPMDRMLVRHSLEKEHGGFFLTEADSEEEFLEHIKSQEFDIVLTDFNILGYEGLQVLDTVLQEQPETPVIIVTGTGSESVAVESMKRGAADYVIKSAKHIMKLPETILRALELKKIKQEKEKVIGKLEINRQNLNAAEKIAKIGNFTWDVETGEVTWSEGLYFVLGYDHSETIDYQKINQQIHHPEDLERVTKWLFDCIQSGNDQLTPNIYRLIRKDSSVIYVQTTGIIKRTAGKSIVFATVQDISERKQHEKKLQAMNQQLAAHEQQLKAANHQLTASEEQLRANEEELKKQLEKSERQRKASMIILKDLTRTTRELEEEMRIRGKAEKKLKENEAKLQNIIDNSTNLFYTHTVDHEITFLSPQVLEILGYTEEEAMKRWTDFATDNPINEEGFKITENAIKTGERQPTYELELQRKDGKKILVEVREAPLVENGKVIAIVGSLTDITERKKAEEKLKNSEAKFRSYVDSAPDGIFIADEKGKYVDVNPAATQITGYSREELLNLSIPDLLQPDFIEKGMKGFNELTQKGTVNVDLGFVTKSGEYCFWNVSAVKLSDTRFLGFVKDITDRKKAEEALKDSEDFLNRTGEIARVGGWYLCDKFDKVYWTQTTGRIHELPDGYFPSLEEAINYYHPDDQALVAKCVEAAINEEKPFDFETRLITAKGNLVWVQALGQPEMKNGKCVRLSGTFQDITERKKAEIALRESESSLQDAQRIANIGNWSLDITSGEVHMSDEMFHLIGISKSEGLDVSQHEKYYTPESWAAFQKALQKVQKTGENYKIEMEFADKDAGCRFAIARGEAVFDENKNLIALKGTLQDITERKQAENESKLSKNLLRKVMDIVPTFICAKNLEGRFILINKKLTDFYGTTVDEMTGILHADICEDEDELQDMLTADREVIESGKVKFIPEETMKNPDGSITVLETHKIPFTALGEPAVLIASLDITERKQAEEKLLKSEEKYHELIATTSEGFWLLDSKKKTVDVNQSLCDMLGYSRNKMIGKTPMEFADEENKKIFEEQTSKITSTLHRSYEILLRRKDGINIPTIFNATTLFDKDGKPFGSFAFITDITERKEAEVKIEKELRENKILLSEIHHRVKNNLQTLSSLLQLQKDLIVTKEDAINAFESSQDRIIAMARAYELLLHSEYMSDVNVAEYIKSIVHQLKYSYDLESNISIKYNLENCHMEIQELSKTGLIINELVTNAFKYAFKEKEKGTVIISLKEKNDIIYIEIADNGVGLPKDADFEGSETLGLSLVSMMILELQGTLNYKVKNGTKFMIKIPKGTKKTIQR
jgi:PAS domain S-box-containing protein